MNDSILYQFTVTTPTAYYEKREGMSRDEATVYAAEQKEETDALARILSLEKAMYIASRTVGFYQEDLSALAHLRNDEVEIYNAIFSTPFQDYNRYIDF